MLKKIFLVTCVIISLGTSHSQTKTEIKKLFQEAEYYVLYEEFADALPSYLKIDATPFTNSNIKYRIGLCYMNIPFQKNKAIPYLEEAVQNVTKEYKEGNIKETKAPELAYYLLAKAYRISNNPDKAIDYFKKYSSTLSEKEVAEIYSVEEEIKSCERAIELTQNPVNFLKINLSEPINTRFSNTHPVISNDGNILIYSSKLKFYNAIYYSKKENDTWKNPVNITMQVGSDGEFYPSSLSFDNKTLLLFKDEIISGDLYISRLDTVNDIWLPAEKLPRTINSKYWETHGCFSPDGKTIYFTSNRMEGYGGLDIYSSTLNNEGLWDEAINLGPVINSPLNEETPFLTEDGKSLYFSSQGHYSMGGFDIFCSKLTDENNWSKPINLGYPLNTTDDDKFYSPVKNGEYAYFSAFSDRDLPIADIYRIQWLEKKLPKSIEIQGTITLSDNITEFFNYFSVDIIDTETKDTLRKKIPVGQNGQYSTQLKRGKYRFIITGKGYQPKTEDIIIPDDFNSKELTVQSEMTPVSVYTKEHFTIKNIYFEFDNYSLNREGKIELEKLLIILKDHPDFRIQVVGHTDALGSQLYNQILSEKRAETVMKYLVDNGIERSRMIMFGEGEKTPAANNINPDGTDNPEGRRYNRRVELKIISPDNPSAFERKPIYTIQVMALLKFPGPQALKGMKDIKVSKGSDGYYRCTFGEYLTYNEAAKELNYVRKSGFESAFIKKIADIPGY